MPRRGWGDERERRYERGLVQRRRFEQLYGEARARGIRGRSKMNEAQLERALRRGR